MDVEIGRHVTLDLVEELAELDGAVTREALADDVAGGDVEGREQRSDAVALVVVSAASVLRRATWPGRRGNMGWLRSSA